MDSSTDRDRDLSRGLLASSSSASRTAAHAATAAYATSTTTTTANGGGSFDSTGRGSSASDSSDSSDSDRDDDVEATRARQQQQQQQQQAPPLPPSPRLTSLDLFRGFICAVMAWDHSCHAFTRDRDKYAGWELWQGQFATYGNSPKEFLARAVAHICAPGFFLTMGMGMALLAKARIERSGWTWARVIQFFVMRGAVIMLLNPSEDIPGVLPLMMDMGLHNRTVPWFAGSVYHPGQEGTLFLRSFVMHWGVLFTLGATMLLGSFLLVPPIARAERAMPGNGGLALSILICLGLFIISNVAIVHAQGGHLSDPTGSYPSLPATANSVGKTLGRVFLFPGMGPAAWIFIDYPIIPWSGLTALGVGLGMAIARDSEAVFRRFREASLWCFFCFVLVRTLGGSVGNFRGWARGERDVGDKLEWWLTTKYPPDMAYALATLSANLMLLYVFSRVDSTKRVFEPLLVFGRTPLFFYACHMAVLGLMRIPFRFSADAAVGKVRLELVVFPWLILLVVVFFACRRFEAFKRTKSVDSLWRLL